MSRGDCFIGCRGTECDFNVWFCLQMVSRDLTQVLSPSTRLEGNMQAEAVHLLALREVIR
jgi:hypothetical protein